MFSGYERYFRKKLRAFQLHFLLVHLNGQLCLLQTYIALGSQQLPVIFRQCLDFFVQQCRVGDYFCAGWQVEGSHQLVVYNLAGILHFGEL